MKGLICACGILAIFFGFLFFLKRPSINYLHFIRIFWRVVDDESVSRFYIVFDLWREKNSHYIILCINHYNICDLSEYIYIYIHELLIDYSNNKRVLNDRKKYSTRMIVSSNVNYINASFFFFFFTWKILILLQFIWMCFSYRYLGKVNNTIEDNWEETMKNCVVINHSSIYLP